MNLPVYRFLKEPLIRRFGEEWYTELESAAKELKEQATWNESDMQDDVNRKPSDSIGLFCESKKISVALFPRERLTMQKYHNYLRKKKEQCKIF